ncbi:LysE family transporter [Alphaproteobacteria bacterium]|nr:LysE family transporter [Alphaproteobacteria bacterium]
MINSDLIQGFVIGLALIVAIGPQNLFVIQQGLKKSYVFAVSLICSVSDTFLIIIGITLSSYLSELSDNLVQLLKYLGSGWLLLYGILKIKNSYKIKQLGHKIKTAKFKNIIFITLAFTFLNPHVYLDTIILIGTISLNFNNKLSFAIGVITSSFLFFFSLGYLSKYLSAYFNNKKSWLIIDNFFGFLMICYGLYFIYNG